MLLERSQPVKSTEELNKQQTRQIRRPRYAELTRVKSLTCSLVNTCLKFDLQPCKQKGHRKKSPTVEDNRTSGSNWTPSKTVFNSIDQKSQVENSHRFG